MATLKSFADLATFPHPDGTPKAAPAFTHTVDRVPGSKSTHGPSWSSKIKDWLLGHTGPTISLTSHDIAKQVHGCSFGAVSGFMSKMVAQGVATREGKRDGAVVYRIELAKLKGMHVRRTSTAGSKPGVPKNASHPKHDLPVIPATSRPDNPAYDLVSALLEAAAFAETVVPLREYTTEQLIDEIHRRVHAGEK